MKHTEVWTCEHCGENFYSEKECLAHEEKHKTDSKKKDMQKDFDDALKKLESVAKKYIDTYKEYPKIPYFKDGTLGILGYPTPDGLKIKEFKSEIPNELEKFLSKYGTTIKDPYKRISSPLLDFLNDFIYGSKY